LNVKLLILSLNYWKEQQKNKNITTFCYSW